VFTSTLGFDAIGQQTSVFSQFGELVYGISQASQVWLDHQVVEQNGVLMFTWDAVADLFPPGMLEDMFTAYCGFLQQLAKSDHLWQQTTCQLIPAVQLQQRTRLNCVELPIPEATLYGLFTAQVRQQANTSAVITARQTLTYHDLDVRSRQVAFELQQQGVAANQLVAIVMEKGWEQVVAVLGVLAAGAAYVPIDPSLPSERLQYLLDNSQAQIVLTQSWLIDHLTLPVNIQSVAVDTLQPPSSPLPLHPVSYAPDDLAYVIYTSGSTGLPKGVMITHRSVVNVVITTNRRFQISASDRILALTALNHDLSVYDLFGLLSAGGAIVMPDADALKDPAHWVALMQQERVTLWNSVPALMGVLVDHQEHRAQPLPSSLRLAILGGDWVPVSLPARIQALSNSIQLLSIGGPTETTIWNISYLINTVDPSWTSIPYGQPMANSKYYILSDRLEDCPVWVPGQLYCAGVQLANGYWRNPEKTAASFISHPCTGERLYRTGDMGRYLPDGNIEFLGREDFQIKLRGYRIEAGEIEAALRQHPAVREAVVTVVGEPPEPQRLAAYMVLDRAQAQAVSDTQQLNPEQAQHRWMSVTQAGQHQAQQSVWDIDLPSFSTIWNYQNYLYTLSVCQALRQLGVYQSPGETHEVDSLMTQCQIAPRYRKWLQRALQILVTEGVLTQQGEAFTSQVELLTQVSPDRQTELQTTLARYQQGFIRTWLDRIPMGPATDLAATLTEMLHSAEQYTAATTQELYQILFADCNAIATAIIKTLVQTLDPEKPLRILEVGAGYGSTTRHLLPLLPPERTTYVFTDISNFFLQTAQLNFVDYPFMRYARLDLEHNPHAQGYELHSFDVVIAATVLHNTRSIYESLQHVRSLLAPGGVLLAIEKTKFHPLFDLTMGLQKGFERFEDTDLRPDHPILSKAQWQHVLAATGFVDSQFMNVADSVADAIGFDVLVAQGSATVQRFQPDSLREFLHQKLPEYMVPTHMIVLDALPLTANGKVDRLALPGVGEPRSPLTPAPDVLPRTATERRIAEIWQAVLNRGTVSIHDNFFALGGDSLQATQVITRLRDAFQLELSLQTALEAPTLEHLATTIDQMQQLVHQLQAPLEQASNREEVML
jgi:amino acid adenylation domain-containing protein